MHRLRSKRVLVVLLIILLIAGTVVGYALYVASNDKQPAQKNETLKDVSVSNVSADTPDDKYLNNLKNFTDKTSDQKEQGLAFKRLGDAYALKGMYKEAFDAYSEALKLKVQAGFTDEEVKTMETKVLALQYQITANSTPPATSEPGFKEPGE